VDQHCEDCAEIFADSFPPVNTFVQRHRIIEEVIGPTGSLSSCIACYRTKRRVATTRQACWECAGRHARETRQWILAWLFCREQVGEDVARLIVMMGISA
jgi:hypothetical protein